MMSFVYDLAKELMHLFCMQFWEIDLHKPLSYSHILSYSRHENDFAHVTDVNDVDHTLAITGIRLTMAGLFVSENLSPVI